MEEMLPKSQEKLCYEDVPDMIAPLEGRHTVYGGRIEYYTNYQIKGLKFAARQNLTININSKDSFLQWGVQCKIFPISDGLHHQ